MIALITPTGARPEQFELCAKWMLRQTYTGAVAWIIVDDADPISTANVKDNYRDNWVIHKIFPLPVWKGENTQARNIREGISFLVNNYSKADIDAVFIIEDDDYYRPIYLKKMMEEMGGYQIIGETNTIYYNVQTRRYVINPNKQHASLFQTAFSYDAIPYLEKCYYHQFIDCVLWRDVPGKRLFFNNYLSVGMKGMPGRGGIGAGHKLAFAMNPDPNMRFINNLIGEEDAKEYARYFSDYRNSQHSLFNKRVL